LTPDNAAALAPVVGRAAYADYSQPAAVVVREADNHRAAIFEIRGEQMVNVTAAKAEQLRRADPVLDSIDVASPGNAALLSGQWHEAENSYRWTGQRAAIQIAAPGQVLTIQGFCVAEQVKGRPFGLTLTMDGAALSIWTTRCAWVATRGTWALRLSRSPFAR